MDIAGGVRSEGRGVEELDFVDRNLFYLFDDEKRRAFPEPRGAPHDLF